MSENEQQGGEEVPPLDLDDVELPPDVGRFLAEIRSGKKTLMRGKAYAVDTGQLRAFIGTHLFTYIEKSLVLLTVGYLDAVNLAASTAQDVKKLRRRVKELEDEVDDVDGDGLSADDADELEKLNDDMLQALFGLGEMLEKKLPADAAMQKAFNGCIDVAKAMHDVLMEGGGDDVDDVDEKEGDEDEKKEPEPKGAPVVEPPAPENG